MNSIYAITTHHDRKDAAAQAWRECGVCAVGWWYDYHRGRGKALKEKLLKKQPDAQGRLFLNIKRGDLILAYSGNKTIAYVGTVRDGQLRQTDNNKVGREEDKGGFGYPNQCEVDWLDSPSHFSVEDLPSFLKEQIGKPYRSIVEIKTHKKSFDEVKDIILTNAVLGCQFEMDEKTVKAGIVKYLGSHMDHLEEGLKITSREEATCESDRPDFLAEDKGGRKVLIECKGHAYAVDCGQLERYGKDMGKKSPD